MKKEQHTKLKEISWSVFSADRQFAESEKWLWVRKRKSLIFAAQEQSIRMNAIKVT